MNKFSIVIPTMWKSEKIFKMLETYVKSNYVGEIIIIDNEPDKKFDLTKYKKLKYYTSGENIFVNPSWNKGAKLAKYKLILANDDIIIYNFDDVLKLILESNFDIIGVDLKSTGNKMEIVPINKFPKNSYGSFMYVKNYFKIPEELKIWYGDELLFNNNEKRGIIKNIKIETNVSETINSSPNIRKIAIQDIEKYNKLYGKI